ncbi:hypothetical protein ACFGOO_00315 [Treponema vincentii]|uniref:hypothetical protein n=1 Tax=Treponema vincentii TaxID=69710 RepID=UPI0035F56E13
MKALRIPRKDHDVYCIDITNISAKSKLHTYIHEQLLLIHPIYGADTAVDIKKLKYKEREWAVVTVMQKETLNEYRILYPHTSFVTATTLAIFEKDFFTKEAHLCGQERIWFDAQQQLIISEETGTEEYGKNEHQADIREDETSCVTISGEAMRISGEQGENPQEREEPVSRAGRRSVVFARTWNLYKTAVIGIGVILTAALIAYMLWATAYHPQQEPIQPEQQAASSEISAEKIPTVTPIRFLEVIAKHTPSMQAVLERYRYTSADGVLCTFRSNSLENSITVFQTIPHRTGCAIKEITQKDKETVVTIQTEPDIPEAVFTQTADPAVVAGFTDTLKAGIMKTDAVVKHERNMQITMNGLSIALSALIKIETIDAFMHDIELISGRYSFGINLLEVAAVDGKILSVHTEFQQIEKSGSKMEETAAYTSEYSSPVIARAFGYTEKETEKELTRQVKTPAKENTAIPEGSIEIGKIQTNGKIKIYYRTPEGKIISIETNS